MMQKHIIVLYGVKQPKNVFKQAKAWRYNCITQSFIDMIILNNYQRASIASKEYYI